VVRFRPAVTSWESETYKLDGRVVIRFRLAVTSWESQRLTS
jgi:hypothetical protein